MDNPLPPMHHLRLKGLIEGSGVPANADDFMGVQIDFFAWRRALKKKNVSLLEVQKDPRCYNWEMPPPLSTLGVFHTFATVMAIYLAVDNLIDYGRINLKSRSGFVYFVLTIFGCVSTIWLVARTGHYGPGHALAAVILVLLLVSWFLESRIEKSKVLQALLLTTTLLFSLIPAIMETLTRLPVDQPFAASPEDMAVKSTLGVVFIAYLSLAFWQMKKFRISKT